MALVAVALFATACSGSGVSRSTEVQPVYLQDTAIGGLGSGLGPDYDRTVSDYLEGTGTLEEVAELIHVVDPVEVPVDEFFRGYGNVDDTPEEVLQRLAKRRELAATGYDNSDEPHELSLSAVAKYYSSYRLSWALCGLRGCFEDALLPVWWEHAIESDNDSYHDYAFLLQDSLREHFQYSRLDPLTWLHVSGFKVLYCLEMAGVNVDGLAEILLLEVADSFDLSRYYLHKHAEVARRGSEIGFTEDHLQQTVADCHNSDVMLVFSYPYDVAQAHRLLQEYFLEFLRDWVVEHRDEQPDTLTIVG